jgi:hypothetical protein
MSKHIKSFVWARSLALRGCCGVLALLLAACAGNSQHKEKAHDAAVYNVQLGLA